MTQKSAKMFRASTGGFVNVVVQDQTIYFYARGDNGQVANVSKEYLTQDDAMAEFDNIINLAGMYGLTSI